MRLLTRMRSRGKKKSEVHDTGSRDRGRGGALALGGPLAEPAPGDWDFPAGLAESQNAEGDKQVTRVSSFGR